MPIKWRLTLYSTASLGGILILLNVFIYFTIFNTITGSERVLLEQKNQKAVTAILNQWERNGASGTVSLPGLFGYDEMARVVNQNGEVLQAWNRSDFLDALPIKGKMDKLPLVTKTKIIEINDKRTLVTRTPFVFNRHFYRIETMEVLDRLERYIETLMSLLIGGSAMALLFVVVIGYGFSRTAFKPVSAIIHSVKSISAGNLSKRLPLSKSKDEIYGLALTFNEMMARMEETFKRQQRFLADASHELRTPLTIIEGYIQLLKRWGNKNAEIQEEAFTAIHHESRRLKGLMNEMIQLIQMDGQVDWQMGRMNLTPLIRQASQPYIDLTDREITMSLDDACWMTGDGNKLEQAIRIVLDNAVKYTQSHGHIKMTLTRADNNADLAIEDDGEGIPSGDLPFLFERFYRVDKSRSRAGEQGGYGLGLSIAKMIVEHHGGTIGIASEWQKGTRVVIRFPLLTDEKVNVKEVGESSPDLL